MLKFDLGLIYDGDSEMLLGGLSYDKEEINININQVLSHGDLIDLIEKLREIEEGMI
jgi:hypothetical protein